MISEVSCLHLPASLLSVCDAKVITLILQDFDKNENTSNQRSVVDTRNNETGTGLKYHLKNSSAQVDSVLRQDCMNCYSGTQHV